MPVIVDKPFAVDGGGRRAGGRRRGGGRRAGDRVPEPALGRRLRHAAPAARMTACSATCCASSRASSASAREIKEGWRELGAEDEGGGQLLDLGPHLVDQARVLFGHPVRVYAEVAQRREGASVDDDAFVALEHPGGERSHLWMSAITARRRPADGRQRDARRARRRRPRPAGGRSCSTAWRIGDARLRRARRPARLVDAAGERAAAARARRLPRLLRGRARLARRLGAGAGRPPRQRRGPARSWRRRGASAAHERGGGA